MGNRDKLGNPGRFLIQRCLAVKFHKENGIVATREGDFESLSPDHYFPIVCEPRSFPQVDPLLLQQMRYPLNARLY